MTVKEARRRQRQELKKLPFKERLAHFWEYNRLLTVGIVLAVIAIISLVSGILSQRPVVFGAAMINAEQGAGAEAYMAAFAQSAGIDTGKGSLNTDCSISISLTDNSQASYTYMQRLLATVSAHEVDVLASDMELFIGLAYRNYLADLRTVLSEDELSALEGQIFYIDGTVLKAVFSEDEAENVLLSGDYPDPFSPAGMDEPIPVGISLDNASEDFCGSFSFKNGPAAIGVASVSERPELAGEYLLYVLSP